MRGGGLGLLGTVPLPFGLTLRVLRTGFSCANRSPFAYLHVPFGLSWSKSRSVLDGLSAGGVRARMCADPPSPFGLRYRSPRRTSVSVRADPSTSPCFAFGCELDERANHQSPFWLRYRSPRCTSISVRTEFVEGPARSCLGSPRGESAPGFRPGSRVASFASPKEVTKKRRPDGGGPADAGLLCGARSLWLVPNSLRARWALRSNSVTKSVIEGASRLPQNPVLLDATHGAPNTSLASLRIGVKRLRFACVGQGIHCELAGTTGMGTRSGAGAGAGASASASASAGASASASASAGTGIAIDMRTRTAPQPPPPFALTLPSTGSGRSGIQAQDRVHLTVHRSAARRSVASTNLTQPPFALSLSKCSARHHQTSTRHSLAFSPEPVEGSARTGSRRTGWGTR